MTLTPEDLRQRIPTWSLESDGQLLQYMISIAKNLEEKCTKTRDNLNSLMLQVNQTELKLSNATNQFSAVEQVKFVENRVEEDDESFYGLRRRRQQQQQQQQQQLVDERTGQKEPNADASLDDLIQLAVERSIEGMYSSYEKVTLQLTDSDTSDDEEEEQPSSGSSRTLPEGGKELSGGKTTIMRAFPRQPFIDRPLPHVIGSKEWQNKWHVGLIDSDDESSSDRKEEYSESSASETDDDDRGMYPSQPNSKNHTPSESESSGIWGAEVGHRKRAPSIDPSITGDDGSSVYSYASSSKPRAAFPTHPALPRGPVSLGASLKPPNLFPEEPPEEVGDIRRRNDRGLFDESPEEDEESSVPLPTPIKTAPTTDSTAPFFKGTIHQPTRKTVNLFDDEPPSLQEPGDRIPEPKKTINLFIESDNEEEANENTRNNNNTTQHVEPTVVAKPSTNARRGQPTTTNRTMAKLVDELNNNFRKPAPATRSSNPAVQPGKQRPTATNLFDDEPPVDDFDQMFSGSKGPITRQPTAALPQPATRTVVEKKPVNLFEDDAEDDDDAFEGLVVGSNEKQPEPIRSPFISPNRISFGPKQQQQQQQQQQPARTSKSKSIFDDSDSEAETKGAGDSGLFANVGQNRTAKPVDAAMSGSTVKTPLPKPVKSIFDDSSETEDDDDALFGRSSDIVKNKLDALKRNGAGSATTKPVTGPVNATRGRTSTKDEAKTVPTNKTKSIFDEDSDDDTIVPGAAAVGSLFAKEPSGKQDTPKPTPMVGGTTSLFDNDSTTDDDQPGGVEGAPKPAMQPQMKDEFLFSEEKSKLAQKPNDRLEVVGSVKTEITTFSDDPLGGSVVATSDVSKSIPEAPAVVSKPSNGPADSIRSMIMKKSIFNSDSESEEDDSIFGSSAAVSAKVTSVPEELEATKSDTNEGDSEAVHLKQDRETMVERPPVEATLEEMSPCESAEQTGTEQKHQNLPPFADEQPLDNNAGSLNKEAVSPSISDTVNENIPSDFSEELPVNENTVHTDTNAVSKQPTLGVTKPVETQSARLDQSSKQQTEEGDRSTQPDGLQRSLDIPQTGPPVEKEKVNDSTTPGAVSEVKEPPLNPPVPGMIANDIDYFLHTNELSTGHEEPEVLPRMATPPPPAVKSEPKSALNFSPIGLFDDVPPPDDDESDRDDRGPKRHFHQVDPGSSLQSVDDPVGYPTESQSLNFIPNGSGGGNGRTRYLFDDEPPPDEADNSSPSFGEVPPPFRGVVPKALFEERQRNFDAPASLPPMISESDKAPPRPKVNKLNSKLAINVAALLPGARRPPSTATAAPLTKSDSPDRVSERSNLETTQGSLDESAAVPTRTAGAGESKGEKLTSLNKGRARIPTKRKPPSRQTLRAAAVPERQNADDAVESDDRIVVGSEEKLPHIEAAIAEELVEKRDISKLDPLVDRLSASVRNPSTRNVRPDGTEGFGTGAVAKPLPKQLDAPKSASIFDDSDGDGDGDDFFSKLPGKVPSKQPMLAAPGVSKANHRSIFGSDEDDDGDGMDDIFGGKTSTIAKQLQSKPPFEAETKSILGVASVKPPPPKAPVSLFGDDNSDGDDDLFGSSKTKSLAKPSETKASMRPPQSSMTTKAVSTTRTVKDPLADLLN